MEKVQKKIVIREDIPHRDYFYKLNEDVARLSGVVQTNTDQDTGEVRIVEENLTVVDKTVYSIMFHRYLSFKDANDKAHYRVKKPDGKFYFDNQVDIARMLGVDRKTINKSVNKLTTLGVVEKMFQNTKTGAGNNVKSLSYKVHDIFEVKNLRCFFDDCTEGSNVIYRSFIIKRVANGIVALQHKPLVKKPYIVEDLDDPEECPF